MIILFLILFTVCTAGEIYLAWNMLRIIKSAKKTHKKLIKLEREYARDTKKLFEHNVRLTEQLQKTINLIKTVENNMKTVINNMDKDIDNIFKWNKKLGEAVISQSTLHNQLVDVVYDNFKEVFCDLNDCCCEDCYFEGKCPNFMDDLEESPTSDSLKTEQAPPIKAGVVKQEVVITTPEGPKSFKIDRNDPEVINKIREALKTAKIPALAIEEILSTIINRFQLPVPANKAETKIPSNKKENDLIDPASKIVKSLERILKSDK